MKHRFFASRSLLCPSLTLGLVLLASVGLVPGLAAEIPPPPPGGWPAPDKSLDCDVTPLAIEFGPTPIFETETRYYRVINQSTTDLVLDPTCELPEFVPEPGPLVVAPGATVYSWITFTAGMQDTLTAVVDLGPEACASITCVGVRQRSAQQETDLIGITFDPALLEYGLFDPTIQVWPYTMVTAYLALVNPSSDAAVSGWECCLGIEGAAQLASFQGAGGPINILSEPCFMVGLQSPLPAAPYHILATLRIWVPDPSEPIVLSLDPLFYASIPDRMCWLTAGEEGQLVPMTTPYGSPEVATISAHPLSGVGGEVAAARSHLLPNVPNPFNPRTEIRFEMRQAGVARIEIFDAAGRRVRTLLDERREAGPQAATWDGRDDAGRGLASGSYTVRLDAAGDVDAIKTTLLR